MFIIWIGFLVSLAGILIISRKNLALALISGAFILGLFTMPIKSVLDQVLITVTDPLIIFLTLAMGVIPVIGGTMKESGQIDDLVNNLRIPKRYLLASSPALMGLLPMPGGALLSAPIVEKAGEGVAGNLKAAINNWFRHLFILIYPLAPALIVSAEICDLDVYQAIIYLLPGFLLALLLGYFFMLRHVNGRTNHLENFSWSRLAIPLIVILCAPVIDFTLKRAFSIGSLATLIGVIAGLILSIVLSQKKLDLKGIILKMKPWNFGLIIIGMFLYLHIFKNSDARNLIAALPLPPLILAVTSGFLLGFLTGRVQLPASIILPVYLATEISIDPFIFSLIYISIYFGYVISPVHPCLVVTCEYFHITIKDIMKMLIPSTLIIFFIVLLISLFIVFH